MAVRKTRARRELITRTARVWSRLTKKLEKELNEIADSWIKELCEAEFPEKFTKILKSGLREALAYGYWLQWLYLSELRGNKYQGKITLSDGDSVKDSVQKFMNTGEWNEVVPKDAVNWINNYVPKLSGNFSSDVLDKTRDVIKNSLQEGTTLQQREKELQKVLDVSKSRIENIARTEITRAHNLGSLAAMKANQDVIGVEFSAVLDNRTTPMCSERHGLRMRLDDDRIPFNTPPLHCRCRSMLISLTVYDNPDGLLTSHEFEEVSAGEQRPEDIEEVRKIVEPQEEPTLEERALHINELNETQKISLISELANSRGLPYNLEKVRHGEEIYKDDDGLYIYPPNDGFSGKIEDVILSPGDDLIDRYGGLFGHYFSPENTPFEARALPSTSNDLSIYHKYRVLRPLPVKKGTIAGWFEQPGGGIQYKTGKNVFDLLDEEYIKEIK